MTPNVLNTNASPTISSVLSPLQLALAAYMYQGTIPPFCINQEFLAAVKEYSDTNCLSLMTTDYVTGQPKEPDVNPIYAGNLAFVTKNNNIFVQNVSYPEPNVTEYTFTLIGTKSQIAPESFAYFGGPIINGTAARGSGDWDADYVFENLPPEGV